MYNIDFSFLHGSQTEENPTELDLRYNHIYKEYVITNICPNFHSDIRCADCNIHATTLVDIDPRKIVEIDCHGLIGHHFCEIPLEDNTVFEKNDLVILKIEDYNEIAAIDESGDIVRFRRQRLGMLGESLPVILRKADEEDLKKYRTNLCDEQKARPIFKEKIEKFELNMKLVDIHFQFDRKRLFFFYTSDGRVDFRELAKELAAIFKTRIELRQIGVRDEAKRIGGLGACGREYCCSSFLNNFKRITTQTASDQNLSTNLSKLSGPCGKLKCCLSFEIDGTKDCTN
jgi:cell fate regulator YaaT (PSP1 superfamily)